MASFSGITYEEILHRLNAALDFCRSLNLKSPADRGRFSHYRRRIERLVGIVQGRSAGELDPAEEARILKELHAYLVALSEGFEFGDIVPRLAGLPPATLAPKLKAVLKGPALPNDEVSNSNNARNLLFELNMAASLKRAGFHPELGEHPDVACDAAGKTVLIECKRPFTDTGVSDAVESAGKQLQDQLDEASRNVGIIAVSISKALNPGFKPIRVADRRTAQVLLVVLLEEAAKSVGAICARFYDSRVVGIVFHVIAVFENLETNRYETGQQYLAYPFVLPADDAYLEIGEALKNTEHGIDP